MPSSDFLESMGKASLLAGLVLLGVGWIYKQVGGMS